MSSSPINYSAEFVEACRRLWRDGFDKGVDGDDDYPEFSQYFPQTCLPVAPKNSSPQKKGDVSYEELEKLPFNPLKCEARLEKHGYAIQCTRNPFEGGCLCKTHMNQLSKVHKEGGEGKDLPYGRFNQPRPDVTLDKGNPISWGPKKGRSKSPKDKTSAPVPKLKVGEMRDYLATRVAVTAFRGMKKKELTALYMSEKSKEEATPPSSPGSVDSVENSSSDGTSPDQVVEGQTNAPDTEEVPKDETDDGAGCGLHLLEPLDSPKTVSDYRVLFDKLGIDYSDLKGRPAYQKAYTEYLKEKEEEKDGSEETQPMSDDEDDGSDEEELKMDENSYDEISFEGVVYYEEEETGKIYNVHHQEVGKWNSDGDDIIWISPELKEAHENHPR